MVSMCTKNGVTKKIRDNYVPHIQFDSVNFVGITSSDLITSSDSLGKFVANVAFLFSPLT